MSTQIRRESLAQPTCTVQKRDCPQANDLVNGFAAVAPMARSGSFLRFPDRATWRSELGLHPAVGRSVGSLLRQNAPDVWIGVRESKESNSCDPIRIRTELDERLYADVSSCAELCYSCYCLCCLLLSPSWSRPHCPAASGRRTSLSGQEN